MKVVLCTADPRHIPEVLDGGAHGRLQQAQVLVVLLVVGAPGYQHAAGLTELRAGEGGFATSSNKIHKASLSH